MTSIQEAAMAFANTITASLNSSIANMMGVEVMWFRLIPDKKNQDVIFQSYTLFGVEDCPLVFNAMYSDTGYDDAAITYNIMGLEYSVPLTLEIPVQTWNEITKNDGTLPQRGDIVFIPLSNKLVEVVSMTPVKAMAAQITTYKVNCSIYKPSRSRIVGDNLKTSVKESTVNLDSRFGKDIENTFANVVDDNQISIFTSTAKDEHKEITKENDPKSDLITAREVNNIISEDILIDGHIISRSYYDMEIKSDVVVKYTHKTDIWSEGTERCLSCWINIKDVDLSKNIKELSGEEVGNTCYIKIGSFSGKKFQPGTPVVIERGNIVIYGVVANSAEYKIEVYPGIYNGLNKNISNWENLQGYTIRKDNVINLLTGKGSNYDFSIDLKANNYIIFSFGDKQVVCQLQSKLAPNNWYGVVLNISSSISLDVFEGKPSLRKLFGISNIKNKNALDNSIESYCIKSSSSYLTNIRLYDVSNTDLDKQITDLVSFNSPYNSHAIINDSAEVYLNKIYVGRQR